MNVHEDIEFHANEAQNKYGTFASLHEALGVLVEEVAEFTEAVRMRQGDPRRQHIAAQEAIDIAAVAMRIAEQCREGLLTR